MAGASSGGLAGLTGLTSGEERSARCAVGDLATIAEAV